MSAPNIYLLGPRASGKTTLGQHLAERLNRPFVDMDQVIQWTAGQSVADLVASEGWESFRDLEAATLAGLDHMGASVVATGGGVILRPENRERIRQGLGLLLWGPPEVLARRLENERLPGQRPSLTGDDPVAEAARVMAERETLYRECARSVLDVDQPLEKLTLQALTLINAWEQERI